MEEVAWKKRAEAANEYDAESGAPPVEMIAGLLVYEVVVQDAQLILKQAFCQVHRIRKNDISTVPSW